MRRWWDNIAATIVLTVIVAMVLGVSLEQMVRASWPYVSLAFQQTDKGEPAPRALQLPGEIAVLLDLVDIGPDLEKQALMAAAQRFGLHVRILDAFLPWVGNLSNADSARLHDRIESMLTYPRTFIVAEPHKPSDRAALPRAGHAQRSLLIEAALSDGRWLLLSSDTVPASAVEPAAASFSRASFAAWVALSMLCAVALSTLAARRLVRPLAVLATAVEQVGGLGDALPTPAIGPREIKGTIDAFNRMQERLRRFNDDRTRMIAAMSHDRRTPLTRVRLRLEMIEDHEGQAKMLAEIDRMSVLIESMLAFARDDADQEARALVDLSALLEGICQDAADAGEPVEFSGPRDVTILCRPTALRRAFSNIIDNAIKYGARAVVELSTEGDYAVVLIEDDGPGIPRHERKRVFDPFVRLDPSRSPEVGGVGLGLSVARSIVLEHGGEISLGTAKSGGLSVRLMLPVGRSAVEAPAAAAHA